MSYSEYVPLPYRMFLVATVCLTETFLETFANRFIKSYSRVFQGIPTKWFR